MKNSLNTLNFDNHKATKGINPFQESPKQPPIQEKIAPIQPEPSGPKIIFTGQDGSMVNSNKKKGGKSQIVLISLLILITLVGVASFIFLEDIKKIDPSQISFNTIINLITGKPNETTPKTPEIPPLVQPVKPPTAPSGDVTIYGPYEIAGELAMSSGNFTFFYEEKTEDVTYQYIDINGSSYGPYQRVASMGVSRPIVPSVYNDKFGFSYYDARQQAWYVNINGNVMGPYSEVSNVYYSANGYIFAGKKKESIYYYININGKEDQKNPYVTTDNNIYLSDSGSYSFSYTSNNKKSININGKVFGPYDIEKVGKGVMFNEDKFYFLYNDSGKELVNVNGKVYDSSGSVVYDYLKNQFEFHYTKDDGKKYVNLNGKETLDEEKALLAANYSFKKDSEYFVNLGQKKEGPYKNISIVSKAKDSYIFGYQLSDGQWFININGVGNGPYEDISPIVFINEKNSYGYVFKSGGKWYVQIK
ncbi:MAG: hypothetical protein PHW52_00360 [Candidatus Pacebacteria bacterium]|nr:hypothetical protein [Candidatus Paceibacterota bacterium]